MAGICKPGKVAKLDTRLAPSHVATQCDVDVAPDLDASRYDAEIVDARVVPNFNPVRVVDARLVADEDIPPESLETHFFQLVVC
jgi:hypothetical protein